MRGRPCSLPGGESARSGSAAHPNRLQKDDSKQNTRNTVCRSAPENGWNKLMVAVVGWELIKKPDLWESKEIVSKFNIYLPEIQALAHILVQVLYRQDV